MGKITAPHKTLKKISDLSKWSWGAEHLPSVLSYFFVLQSLVHFFHDLIKHQPNRIWFQTFYLQLKQSRSDLVLPSSQKLRIGVPIRHSGSHIPLIFCHICVMKDDLTGSHQSCNPFWSWVSLSTTLQWAQAQAMRIFALNHCGSSSFLPWTTRENSQHKTCLDQLVWDHTESGLEMCSLALSALGFLQALVCNKFLMVTSCFICSPKRRPCVCMYSKETLVPMVRSVHEQQISWSGGHKKWKYVSVGRGEMNSVIPEAGPPGR